jgi:hypothetical protein
VNFFFLQFNLFLYLTNQIYMKRKYEALVAEADADMSEYSSDNSISSDSTDYNGYQLSNDWEVFGDLDIGIVQKYTHHLILL